MLNDKDQGKEVMQKYLEEAKVDMDDLDFQVIVLTSSYWPNYKS